MIISALTLFATSAAAVTLNVTPANAITTETLYSPNISANPNEDASYPRVIRLAHSGSANSIRLPATGSICRARWFRLGWSHTYAG